LCCLFGVQLQQSFITLSAVGGKSGNNATHRHHAGEMEVGPAQELDLATNDHQMAWVLYCDLWYGILICQHISTLFGGLCRQV